MGVDFFNGSLSCLSFFQPNLSHEEFMHGSESAVDARGVGKIGRETLTKFPA